MSKVDEGQLWSLIRTVLSQGAAQEQDWMAGKYGTDYEAYSARVDEAARERVAQFVTLLSAEAPEGP